MSLYYSMLLVVATMLFIGLAIVFCIQYRLVVTSYVPHATVSVEGAITLVSPEPSL